ncbi:hypothetical protein ISS37_05190 [candidate division KSB1 bacterium]|nr:hypothetical protein [candidate division KSB1 bacterium]
MKVTIEIRDDLYRKLKTITEMDDCSIDEEIEMAVLVMAKKRTLIQRLMEETGG